MEASELRLGNWFESRSVVMQMIGDPYEVWRPTQVKHITSIGINPSTFEGYYVQRTETYEEHQWRPIPLTPEILRKVGFKWETDKKRHLQFKLPEQGINKRLITFYYNDGQCEMLQMYMNDYFNGYFEIKPPKYLHQLQNLFFALIGEELVLAL